MTRYLGIDFGTKRIGIAISDESKTLARVLLTLQAENTLEKTCNKLLKEIASYNVDHIIVGLPLHLDGNAAPFTKEVEKFCALLQSKISAKIVLWDERLTTVQAERSLKEANLSRKKRTKIIDSITAVILLQSYLDYQSFNKC